MEEPPPAEPTPTEQEDDVTEEDSTSSTTKTSTMTTTAAKLYGKDLTEYDEIDVDQLLSQLSAEEISMLAKEVDPDDSLLPPSQRCSYECEKKPTGPLDRKKLIEHINKQAMETPDIPELKPYVPGIVRGKKWIPPPNENIKEKEAEEQIAIDLGDEYETALSSATQEEIIDLAAILGFHSMMNQDQYHASLLNKGQPVGLGWDGITKASQPKPFPMEPPNDTDVDKSIQMVKEDSHELTHLNWNNIKNISDEKFSHLFNALRENTHLETLSLTNVGLLDRHGLLLAEAIEKNNCLRVLNVETNFLSPQVVLRLVKSLLVQKTVEEFRASNQRSQVLGNKMEMEITQMVEQNPTLLRLGLHLEYNDARQRVATHLQRNIDRIHHEKVVRQREIAEAAKKAAAVERPKDSEISAPAPARGAQDAKTGADAVPGAAGVEDAEKGGNRIGDEWGRRKNGEEGVGKVERTEDTADIGKLDGARGAKESEPKEVERGKLDGARGAKESEPKEVERGKLDGPKDAERCKSYDLRESNSNDGNVVVSASEKTETAVEPAETGRTAASVEHPTSMKPPAPTEDKL